MKVKHSVLTVNRNRSKYGSTDLVRLHASERDMPFDKALWTQFVNSITQEDIRYYPNVDRAYDLLSQMININKELVTLAEGSDRILKNIFQCFAIKGLKVVTTNPCFPMYKIYSQLEEAAINAVDYTCDKFPLSEFINQIDKQTSIAVISNPSSPVGDALTIEQVESVAQRCNNTGTLLVVDEAYIEFSNIESAISLIDKYDIVVVRTLSKAYGAAGIRLGYSVSSATIKSLLDRVSSMNEVNGLSVKWLEVLLQYGDTDKYVNKVIEHRNSLVNVLNYAGIKYLDSQTNYINVFGKLDLNGILTKNAIMPWDGNVYTRISIPANLDNFNKLLSEIEKL